MGHIGGGLTYGGNLPFHIVIAYTVTAVMP